MIVGIGCDIVEHQTTINLKWDSKLSAQKRIFTAKEIGIYQVSQKIEFLSGRFAAKEAVLKCLGTGMQDGIALTDIQVLQLESGAAFIELYGEAKGIADSLGINVWSISISHTENSSIAFVIAENTK